MILGIKVFCPQIMLPESRDRSVLGYEAKVSLALMFTGRKHCLLDIGIKVFHALEETTVFWFLKSTKRSDY
jgi:hypothetical protein